MNLAEALKAAIGYEARIRDLYRDAALAVGDEVGKRVLQVLQKEEQGHLDYLRDRLSEWQESGKVQARQLKSILPNREDMKESLQRARKTGPSAGRQDELALLNQALELEKETSDFYQSMIQKLDGEDQALFEPFWEIEQGHVTVVQAEIDSLRGLGYWYDFSEFDLEAG